MDRTHLFCGWFAIFAGRFFYFGKLTQKLRGLETVIGAELNNS